MSFSSGIQAEKAQFQQLLTSAETYLSLHYSLIPIHGDAHPERAKAASVAWGEFQRRRPTPAELRRWFAQEQHGGLAIVTGRISGLAVLDLDDEQLAAAFALRFPQLCRTRTVRSATRGQPHYYYQIGGHLPCASRRWPGADWKAEGAYVIAPPTRLGAGHYKLERGGLPLKIDAAQLQAIFAFLDEMTQIHHASPQPELPAPVEDTPIIIRNAQQALPLGPQDLSVLYRHLAQRKGRNQALFEVACRARDARWSQAEAETLLAALHVAQPSHGQHCPETPAQREREARRSIASAYTRPPRPQNTTAPALPNRLREALLQAGLVNALRVLEAVFMAGLQGGMRVTEALLCEKLAGMVGRHSVRAALNVVLLDGEPLFARLDPSPRPLTPTTVAPGIRQCSDKECSLSGMTAPNKNGRGRPARAFLVPDLAALCQRMGVRGGMGDALAAEDLRSGRSYRVGLHRELIKRRPGRYGAEWLAGRLGISRRSVQRYHRAAGVRPQACYRELVIGWGSLERVPEQSVLPGSFLQDGQGRRYPARRAIAMRLLRARQRVSYMIQLQNQYWHPQAATAAVLAGEAAQSAAQTRQSTPNFAPALAGVKLGVTPEKAPQAASQGVLRDVVATVRAALVGRGARVVPAAQPPRRTKRYYRRPLADALGEGLAQRLVREVRARMVLAQGSLSRANARRLVEHYGTALIQRALERLAQRRTVENPAGFVITLLRTWQRTAPWNTVLIATN